MTTTLTSLEIKVARAAKVLETMPEGFFVRPPTEYRGIPVKDNGDAKEKVTTVNYIWEKLEQLGIYKTDESHELLLSDNCTEGDARRVFCEEGLKLPIVRFKCIWSILKQNEDTPVKPLNYSKEEKEIKEPEGWQKVVEVLRPIGQWSDEELLGKYTPNCTSEIVENLDKRANGRPFIIFKNEETYEVDISASLSMLRQARRGKTPVHYKVANCLKKLYRAGDIPNTVLLECPFHPNTFLVDGYCDECGHIWDTTNYENLQFARIMKLIEEQPKEKPYLRQFINDLRQNGIDDTLRSNYPHAACTFDDMKKNDDLPNLKKRISTGNREISDPFNPSGHKTY